MMCHPIKKVAAMGASQETDAGIVQHLSANTDITLQPPRLAALLLDANDRYRAVNRFSKDKGDQFGL